MPDMRDVKVVTVVTRPCILCGQSGSVSMTGEQGFRYQAWLRGELSIQRALYDMSADQREMLMSGTHGECWDRLYGEEEDLDE